jgi:hypothetical protein
MRLLTLVLMVWSAVSIGDGDELNFAITGEVLRKGNDQICPAPSSP